MGFFSTLAKGVTSIFSGRSKQKAQEAASRTEIAKAQAAAAAEKARADVEIARLQYGNQNSGGGSGGMGKNMPYILGAAGIVLATMLSKKR